jgi:uncharacterized membrane protein
MDRFLEMADKPLTLAQISARMDALESELQSLKVELERQKSKSTPKQSINTTQEVVPKVISVTPSAESSKPKSGFFLKWESFLGENLFIKFGLLTMLLGAIWFINLAFEEYWINESVRIWLGIVIGIGVVYQGFRLLPNWPLIGPALVGTGMSLTFASYFLGYFVYDLYSANFAFVGLVLLSLITIAYSYLTSQEVIFGFGILGAFLVPILLSTGENSYQFLFIYLLLWNVLFLLISSKTRWRITPLLLLFGDHLMFGGWAFEKLEQSSYEIPLFFQCSIFLIFLFREHILVPRTTKNESILSTVTVGLAIFFVFMQGSYIASVFFPKFESTLLMGFVVTYYRFFLKSFSRLAVKDALSDIFIASTGLLGLLFILITLAIGFEGRTLSFAALGFAILIGTMGARSNIISLYAISLLFWLVGILNLVFANRWFGEDWFLLNSYFFLYLLSAAMLFVLSRIGKQLVQVADIYKWSAFPVLLFGTWADIYYHIPESYLLLGYTSSLAFYGLSFTIYSFLKPNADLRKIGLIALSIVIGKLYLYDFWNMGTIARILAGFGLGAALVFTGIIYNREKKKNLPPKDLT